jgi:hypothetical protein
MLEYRLAGEGGAGGTLGVFYHGRLVFTDGLSITLI